MPREKKVQSNPLICLDWSKCGGLLEKQITYLFPEKLNTQIIIIVMPRVSFVTAVFIIVKKKTVSPFICHPYPQHMDHVTLSWSRHPISG
jgi:hypothetical protein